MNPAATWAAWAGAGLTGLGWAVWAGLGWRKGKLWRVDSFFIFTHNQNQAELGQSGQGL